MSSIYQDIILDHYQNPKNSGRLKNPTYTISVSNPFCGDRITMDMKFAGNKLEDISFAGQGCAISQAAASMLTEKAKGKTKEELRKWDKESIIDMIGINLSPVRLKCALLSWEALIKILNSK